MNATNNILLDKTIKKTLDALEYVASGFHAVPAENANPLLSKPARHRLYNAGLMGAGFVTVKEVMDTMCGHRINGEHFEKIDKEKVHFALRPLHGILAYNPFSDSHKDQCFKVMQQLAPAVGGALGAIAGSTLFFDPRLEKDIKPLMGKGNLSPIQADTLASYEQGKIARVLAGVMAWVASSTFLTPLYGFFLNTAFWLCNGNKTLAGAEEFFKLPVLREIGNTWSPEGEAPAKALASALKRTANFCYEIKNGANIDEAAEKHGKNLVRSVIAPLFRKFSPEQQEETVKTIKKIFADSYDASKDPAAIKTEIENLIKPILTAQGLNELGEGMMPGNNGWLGNLVEFLDFGKNIEKIRERVPGYEKVQHEVNKQALMTAGAIGAAGVAGFAVLNNGKAQATVIDDNNLENVSAEHYVQSANQQKFQEKSRGVIQTKIIDFAKWCGDAGLAVVPVHRMWSAVGLTAVGGLGLEVAKFVTGRSLASGEAIAADKFPAMLKPLHNIIKYDPLSDAPKDRVGKLAGKFIFAAFCAIGVGMGSKHAYASTEEKNEKQRDSIADFVALAKQASGTSAINLVALSATMGSTSGAYLLPSPLGNYGPALAMRTDLMQNKGVTTPGLKWVTGTKTNSIFGIRNGVDYLINYALHNPDKKPEQFENLALTILSQITDISGIELNGQHIKKLVDTVEDIRAKYWQEGGVPQEKQNEMRADLQQHLTDAGLDRTLYEKVGIDALDADLKKVGGALGWVGRAMGAGKKLEKLQEEYKATILKQRESWIDKPIETEIPRVEEAQKTFAQTTEKANNIVPLTIKRTSIKPEEPASSFQEAKMVRDNNRELAGVGV